jgi:hypothetical protein
MEQGKPLIITGAAFSGIGLLLITASFVFSSSPMLSAGCASTIIGIALVGIAAAMATSGSSIAHRGEEQIPVVYNIPATQPQMVQPGVVQVAQPEPPGQPVDEQVR